MKKRAIAFLSFAAVLLSAFSFIVVYIPAAAAGNGQSVNLISDPGFETAGDDWLLLSGEAPEYSKEVFHGGAHSVAVPAGNGIKLIRRLDVTSGESYRLSAWVYGKVSVIIMMYSADNAPIGYYLSGSPAAEGGEEGKWTEISGRFSVDDTRVGNISIEFRSAGGDCYVDDAVFESSGRYNPQPSSDPVRLGCYYFNSWTAPEDWSRIKYFEDEKIEPVIGYYRLGSKEVMEWHIKQATQHGISFWVFDWYFDVASQKVSEQNIAVDSSFEAASNRDDMEFAIMWCNEEKDISAWSEESLVGMAELICERYLSKGNYLKTPDGRNLFFMTRPDRLISHFGKDGAAAVLKKMNEVAAEYGGFCYVGIKYPTDADAAELKSVGYDALTLYSYSTEGIAPGEKSAPYEKILKYVEPIIRAGNKSGILPIIPCVSPNWDSRPWADLGDRGTWRTGSTPELFAEMCAAMRKYADPGLNMMMVGTWNEFGEGSHIEPTVGKGCSYLDAMQKALFPEAYSEHTVLTPTDEEKNVMDFDEIPPLNHDSDDGNLIVNPGFEKDYGWVAFGSGDMTYSDDCTGGERSLILTVGQRGVKSRSLIPIEQGVTYTVSVWVKGNAYMQCALFDKDGTWINGRYSKFGSTGQSKNNGEWNLLTGTLTIRNSEVAFVDFEIVNANASEGDVLIDDADFRIRKDTSTSGSTDHENETPSDTGTIGAGTDEDNDTAPYIWVIIAAAVVAAAVGIAAVKVSGKKKK